MIIATRKLLLTICLLCVCSFTHAFSISVRSPSANVYGIGFKLNGRNYGTTGKSYEAKNMYPGMYRFGVRVGGLLGRDVPCLDKDGNALVRLSQTTHAILLYTNDRCTVQL